MKTLNESAMDNAMHAGPRDRAEDKDAKDNAASGGGDRPMTDEEELDEALDETFPASDPVAPSRIDGPIKP
ncbi:MAG: hypothetical protein ABJF67_13450 [Aurantimonas coralicida]|uniref:hypothetical protein n=1 Tax=Aurantimonas TaxID=182269 RepID=UPI0004011BF8|nr:MULTISPECIES: hypothetical protein [Aurantimonas]MAY29499.1 hypothetical protein [Aurantimonas sp.]MCW7543532.1 hypothetical protein [Aurantimonas litoralis]MBC6717975.1 hypothetical protein [Aurantimonas sp. DM33-3]MCD1643843.1 hypothetical protein [Aurantimonas coralicida]MDE0924567.1 hypothetical protein [Aurantimonas coralicida]